jgi:hypothetical protein
LDTVIPINHNKFIGVNCGEVEYINSCRLISIFIIWYEKYRYAG